MNGARRSAALRLGLALTAAVASSGCSTSPGQSSPPTSPPADSSQLLEETNVAGFVLTSPSFTEGGAIPVRHSCDGQDVSPALDWTGAPTGTAVFALIFDDPDARGFIHWVAYNIGGDGLAEGVPAAGPPSQGRNDFGRGGYGGPCPPSGTHHYRFMLYALSQPLAISGTPSASEVRDAMSRGLILGQTTLTATYTRKR